MAPKSTPQEQRYDLLVQAVVDYAIFLLDPDGRVTTWNPGAERIKGYTPQEIIGQDFSVFYTPEEREGGVPRRALETAREQGRYLAEGWRVRKDGERFWASVVIDAVRDPDGKVIGFAKVTRDITDQREAQRKLEEAREQLFQSQKIDALGQLTGGLAHDFNNLLTAIISGAELGLRHMDNPERLRGYLESIRTSAHRGGELTRQLLAFARRQPLTLKTIEVPRQLSETAALLRHSLPPNINLVLEVSDPLWPVEADPTQLELSILNLGFNGRDAMPEGGELRISARNASLDGAPDGLVGDFVAISVADTGQGVPPEIRERVFEPFFTTKAFGQGTGLGLSQVFGFAKQSNGALTLDSTVGRGATATIYLPARRTAADSPGGPGGRAQPHILVVEDEPTIADLAAALLNDMGFRTTVANSPGEALQALNAEQVDAVFSDVIMPGGMSGLELAHRIRTRLPELPILLTTGYSEAAVSRGAEFPLLQKPYNFEELSSAIADLLGRDHVAA